MSDTNIYAYGVIEAADLELDVDGVEGASEAYTVEYRTLAAVVSDIETMEPEENDENARAHDAVLRTLLERDDVDAVVPMQFGMTFKNAAALKSVLRGGRRAFTKALRDVDGAVEVGVKLVAGADATLDREAIRADVGERLAAVSDGEVENDLFSDRLVFNRSYLVDADDRERFDEAVEAVEADYEELTLQYTGPWAPYNFVDIRIGAEG